MQLHFAKGSFSIPSTNVKWSQRLILPTDIIDNCLNFRRHLRDVSYHDVTDNCQRQFNSCMIFAPIVHFNAHMCLYVLCYVRIRIIGYVSIEISPVSTTLKQTRCILWASCTFLSRITCLSGHLERFRFTALSENGTNSESILGLDIFIRNKPRCLLSLCFVVV